MKSSVISLLMLIFTVGTASAANKSGDTLFIGFNGGGDVQSNTSDFEDEIIFFQDFFKNKSPLPLNAGGPQTKVVPTDKYGYIDRTFLGEVKLKPTALKRSVEATKKNLDTTVHLAAKAKPRAVTLLFTDHGGPTSLSAWNEAITYDALKKIDDKFDPTTVVRRIHFHCFSGKAIQPKKDFSSESDLLTQYPENRCALSAAREDELSTGFNFDSSYGKTFVDHLLGKKDAPGEKFKRSGKTPSLKDLKSLIAQAPDSMSNPQLTSDLFLEDTANMLCSRRQEFSCSPFEAPGDQTQMRSFMKSFNAKELCRKLASMQATNARVKATLMKANLLYMELIGLIETKAFEYAKKKFKEEYKAWNRSQSAKENLLKCRAAPTSKCKEFGYEKALANFVSAQAEEKFMNHVLTLSKPEGSEKTLPLWGQYGVKPKDPAFEAELDQALLRQPWWQPRYGSKFRDFQNNLLDEISRGVQTRQQEQIVSEADLQFQLLVILANDNSNELFNRYKNIRACESSPMNTAP